MGNTAKGAPYPELSDAPNGPAAIEALAQWVDDRPGISPLTYAQISALSGIEVWVGRIVYQTDTGTSRPIAGPYRYDGVDWVPIADGFVPQFDFLRQVGTATYTVNVDGTYTGFGTSGWTLSLDVPPGATEAFVRTSIESIYEDWATTAAAFQFRTVLDGHNGGDSGFFSGPDLDRLFFGWSTHFTGLTAGAGKAIAIQARRVAGDGSTVLHADGDSYLTHDIRFA